jgi:hypothetical protein
LAKPLTIADLDNLKTELKAELKTDLDDLKTDLHATLQPLMDALLVPDGDTESQRKLRSPSGIIQIRMGG